MRFLYLFVLSFLTLFKLNAQIDTSFWFAAPNTPPALSNSPIQLIFSSYANPATIRVRQPANPAASGGVDLTISLAANTTTIVALTASSSAVLSGATNTVTSNGLYISSTQKISSYFTIGSGNSTEMCALKGTRAAGTDFYTPFPTTLPTLTTGAVVGDVSIDIVATQTGVTTILVTPRGNCVAHAQNVTFAKTLNFGETFSIRDLGTQSPSQLAGSIVSSDNKVAVTISGSTGNSTVCPSFYSDQITNSSEVGKEYVIHNGSSTTNVAYILAPLNSTSLTITSGTVTNWLINSGETFTVNTTAANLSFIQANKPVYVFHVSGYGCKLGGAQVTPAYCAGSYSTAFTRISTDSMFIDMYIRSGYEGGFTLTANASPIPVSPASFSPVVGSSGNLVGARIFYTTAQIPVGAHIVLKNSLDVFGSALHNGSTLGGVDYGYTTEFGTSSFVYANAVPTATICSNTTFTLNGVVGGGPVAGQWSTNGYGSFSGGPNQLTNNIYTPGLLDTVNKPIKIILTSVGFCPNKSDTLKLYVKQGPIVNAGSDQVKCTNNATIALSGNVIGAATQGTWSPVAPANGTFANSASLQTTYFPSNTDTALAYIKIILTSINNGICLAAVDTVKIDLQKAPLVKAAPTSSLVRCTNNSTVNLSGYISNNITSGIWTSSGTGVFVPNNISLTNNYIPSPADMVPPGPIKLKLTTPPSALCKDVSDSVFVYFTDPSTINAGIDLNTCKNYPVVTLTAVVTGTSAGGVVWTGGTGSYAPSNTVLITTYTASGTEVNNGSVLLTVTTTSNGICAATSDQVKVNFENPPTAIFNANTVCLNVPTNFIDQSVNNSNGSLNSWAWDFGDGQTSTLNGTVSNVYSLPGTYTAELVVVDTYGCRDSTSRVVTVYPRPTVKFGVSRNCSGSSQNICFSDSSSVIAPSTLASTGFYWDFGGPGFSVTKDTCFIFPTEGKYSITHNVSTVNGCTAALVQTLNITPPPRALFFYLNNPQPSLASLVDFIDSSSNSVGWFWDFNNGSTSNQQNPIVTYNANGNYTVSQTVTDQFGCKNTYTAVVRIFNVIQEVAQLIPNVISPNGDGKNDFWRLDFVDVFYPNAEIEIFNRWGESIFRSTGYSNAWDGSYKGNPLPVGAYYYTLDLKDPNKPGVIKGNITLIK
jgi:gliding motility-associated-like protein